MMTFECEMQFQFNCIFSSYDTERNYSPYCFDVHHGDFELRMMKILAEQSIESDAHEYG